MRVSPEIPGVKIILLAAMATVQTVFAQDQMTELTELTVDRPGVADTPFTVPRGMYQFEIGLDYFRKFNGEFYDLPTALFRTGLSNKTELRVSTRNFIDHTETSPVQGITPIDFGVKMHIIKQKKWIPETDIMANFVIPVNPPSIMASNIGYEFMLLFQHDFYPNKAINYNVGCVWDSYRGKAVFSGSICFNWLPSRRVGLFIECFDYVADVWPGENGMDGGMTYLLTPSLQLDFSAGVSESEGHNVFIASTGCAFRFKRN